MTESKEELSKCCGAKYIVTIHEQGAKSLDCSKCGIPFEPKEECCKGKIGTRSNGVTTEKICWDCNKVLPKDTKEEFDAEQAKRDLADIKHARQHIFTDSMKSTKQSPIVRDWREELEKLEFPTYRDYGCDGNSDECCGSCGGEMISESETKVKLKSFIEKVVDQQVSKALEGQKKKYIKELEEHAKQNTYEDEEALVYKTTMNEVITKIKHL